MKVSCYFCGKIFNYYGNYGRVYCNMECKDKDKKKHKNINKLKRNKTNA